MVTKEELLGITGANCFAGQKCHCYCHQTNSVKAPKGLTILTNSWFIDVSSHVCTIALLTDVTAARRQWNLRPAGSVCSGTDPACCPCRRSDRLSRHAKRGQFQPRSCRLGRYLSKV